jgi:hypothetical protein
MALDKLENLVKTGQLKTEPPDQAEFEGMVHSARNRLQDAEFENLSDDSRFSLAYGAAHALALAVMRWHGYRSENRYLVFQCLEQTGGLANEKWRVLGQCHKQRNLAEYEGHLEVTPQLLKELVEIPGGVAVRLVDAMGPTVDVS